MNRSAADNQKIFFSSAAAKEFHPVLKEVQEYISGKYSVLMVGEGTEEIKIQVKRYIKKYR